MSSSIQQQMFNSIEQWQQSGVSQKAWYAENNVPFSVFHYWYRRFRNLHPENKKGATDSFVQVKVPDNLSGIPWCDLVRPNGQKLFFHQPLSADFIRSLLALSCCIYRPPVTIPSIAAMRTCAKVLMACVASSKARWR